MKTLMAILLVLVMASSAGAEVLQLHLANNDTAQAQRKQAGDIVSVHNAAHVCGRKTRQNYLIVYVDFDATMTSKEEGHGLMTRLRSDCALDAGGAPVAQCRFKIDLAELEALAAGRGVAIDWKRLRDPGDEYQPFYRADEVIFDYSDLILDKCDARKLDATKLKEIADYATTGVVAVTPGPKEK